MRHLRHPRARSPADGRPRPRPLSDRRPPRRLRDRRRDPQHATTTSRCRRSHRSSGTSRSSPGSRSESRSAHTRRARSCTSTPARSSSRRVIQVFLPMPWLRGLDRGEERLRIVIDWRDPTVKRTFKLMVPVTLGLGLINVNAVIDTFFASRYSTASSRRPRSRRRSSSTCSRRGCSRSRSRRCSSRRSRGSPSRGDLRGVLRHGLDRASRQIAFLLAPTAVVSAVLAEPIIRLLYQRGHWTPAQTPVVAGALAAFSAGLVFNGAMLMLNRAFFSLQSNWIPTDVALGNLALNAILDVVFYRFGVWGIPLATAICNIAGTIALVVLLRRRLGRVGDDGMVAALVEDPRRVGAGRRRVAYAIWRPLDSTLGRSFPAQIVSLGAARSRSRSACTWLPAARCECASCKRYSPCAAASRAAERPWTSSTSATSRSSRTSTTASRRSPIASSQLTDTVAARDMRAQLLDSMDLERERGITIKAQAVRVAWKGHQLNLIDTPGHVDFTYEVSRSLQACEGALLVVDAAQGIEAQTLANAYLAIENDLEIVPVVNKIDLPAADPDGAAQRDRRPARRRPATTSCASRPRPARASTQVLDAIVERIPPPNGDPDAPRAGADLRLLVRPVPRRRRVRARRRRRLPPARGPAGDGARHALRGAGDRRHVAGHAPGRRARAGRGRLRDHRPQGRLRAARRRHAHDRAARRDRAAARLQGRQADGVRRPLPDRLRRLPRAARRAREAEAQRRRRSSTSPRRRRRSASASAAASSACCTWRSCASGSSASSTSTCS